MYVLYQNKNFFKTMLYFSNKDIRNDIQEFRDDIKGRVAHARKCYNDLLEHFNDLSEQYRQEEAKRWQERFEEEVKLYMDCVRHPLYIGKRISCGIYDYKIIVDVEWEMPSLTDDKEYPIIKKLKYEDWTFGRGNILMHKVGESNTAYPENDEGFLDWLERREDMSDA
jgi:hypothetical protein